MAYQTQDNYKLQYFTGTQASIWIGEAWVTECFGISFSATQNIIPIFGYASSTFDAVARGKVLVQGSFEINFVDEGYLYYVLHKMNSEKLLNRGEFNESHYLLTGEAPPPRSEIQRRINDLVLSNETDLSAKEKQQTAVQALEALTSLTLNETDRVIQELDIHRELGNRAGERNNATNIIYDIVPFNLQGIFGNPEFTQDVTEKRLINCFLVSNEMVVASNDEPLKERYSFIGQYHK